MPYSLVPFRPCPFIKNVVVEFRGGDHVECLWRLEGDVDAIRWPVVKEAPGRVEGLWHSTCFEWFYGAMDLDSYLEFNLSPSQDWDAFAFSGLREGMTRAQGIRPLSVTVHRTSIEAMVQATIAVDYTLRLPAHLGLSVVLEDTRGELHYFALHHNTPKPDFHHPDNHVVIGENE